MRPRRPGGRMSDRDAPAMAERAGYDAALEVCRRLHHPELESFPWIGYGTTVDQARIEDALDAIGLRGSEQILHVGTGESGLAKRFASRVRLVDGLTLNVEEKLLADSLGIANYTVHLLSKYSREFLLADRAPLRLHRRQQPRELRLLQVPLPPDARQLRVVPAPGWPDPHRPARHGLQRRRLALDTDLRRPRRARPPLLAAGRGRDGHRLRAAARRLRRRGRAGEAQPRAARPRLRAARPGRRRARRRRRHVRRDARRLRRAHPARRRVLRVDHGAVPVVLRRRRRAAATGPTSTSACT